MNAAGRPDGYSSLQIMLHWSVAILVAFQFFLNDGIDDAWRDFMRGREVEAEDLAAANVHVIIGLVILALALWRIWLRVTRGAPPPPENESPLLRRLAAGMHHLLYLLIVVTPLSGAAAWFLSVEAAGRGHGVVRTLLFFVVILHIAGALVQHFVFRSNVLTRMLMTKD